MVYGSHFPALFEAAAGYGWHVGKSIRLGALHHSYRQGSQAALAAT